MCRGHLWLDVVEAEIKRKECSVQKNSLTYLIFQNFRFKVSCCIPKCTFDSCSFKSRVRISCQVRVGHNPSLLTFPWRIFSVLFYVVILTGKDSLL